MRTRVLDESGLTNRRSRLDAQRARRGGVGRKYPWPTHRVVHCRNLAQAQLALRKIGERFRQCGLELHPEKTRIVYCKDINRQKDFPCVQFTFLGYTFRPRKAVDKVCGRVYVNFSPAVFAQQHQQWQAA